MVDLAQEELQRRREEYNAKSTRLHAVVEGHKQQKDSLRGRIVSSRPLTHPHWHAPLTTRDPSQSTTQSRLTEAEAEVDRAGALTSQLRSLQADIEDKERRIASLKDELKAGEFEPRLAEMHARSRSMELRRDELTAEIRTLSLQADARARLDLKRAEVRSKGAEVQTT